MKNLIPKRRLQFGLRGLFAVVTLAAVVSAIMRIPGKGDRIESLYLLINCLAVGLLFVAIIRGLEWLAATVGSPEDKAR